jgi:hypothetical protein
MKVTDVTYDARNIPGIATWIFSPIIYVIDQKIDSARNRSRYPGGDDRDLWYAAMPNIALGSVEYRMRESRRKGDVCVAEFSDLAQFPYRALGKQARLITQQSRSVLPPRMSGSVLSEPVFIPGFEGFPIVLLVQRLVAKLAMIAMVGMLPGVVLSWPKGMPTR